MECLGYTNKSQGWQNGPRNRRPITALAANSFWSDLKEALLSSSSSAHPSSATFYIGKTEDDEAAGVRFFDDITSLYRRQTMLFQKSCEQLTDIYKVDLSSSSASAIPPKSSPAVSIKSYSKENSSPFGESESKDIDALYADCVFAVLHMIGCDADKDSQAKFRLLEHLRKAFRLDPTRHMRLYETAAARPKPKVVLNVTVSEARDLVTKGNNDPFCTFHLKSDPNACFNTGCKMRTLNPKWNETFVIPVMTDENEEDDVLHLDVWNFAGDDKFGAKLKRIQEVKDGRGLRQFLMETISTSSARHKLIGSVEIPVRGLPACGFNKWWTLEKLTNSSSSSTSLSAAGNSRRTSLTSTGSSNNLLSNGSSSSNRGEIKLAVHLSTSTKPHQTILLEHRRLLRVLLSYELLKDEGNKSSAPFVWRDNFSKETLQILAQHAVQGKLSREDTAMTRWLVYCQMHSILPLDHRVFTPILEKLRKHIVQSEDKEFHEAADRFAALCVAFVRRHRKQMGAGNAEKYRTQLEHALKCLHILHCLKWRSKDDIVVRVEEALRGGVREWFEFVEERISGGGKDCLSNVTRIAHLLIADVNSCKQQWGEIFAETLNIDYAQLTFREYDSLLGQRAKARVEEVCEGLLLKQPKLDKDDSGFGDDKSAQDLEVGTKLFELYLALQQFYLLLPEGGSAADYHEWFLKAVAKWLDMALLKAMRRIVKAVELDTLTTVDDLVKHSSSAVDIRTVFNQIKTFWRQLKWPDPETAFVFISRIMDDVCQAAIFYAERMATKVENEKQLEELLFFSREQCLAMNNVDYVLQSMQPLVLELGMAEVLEKLEEGNGGLVADVCRRSVKTLVKNAVENVENQILQILDQLCSLMSPSITRHLHECSRNDNDRGQQQHELQQLLHLLDENLIFLKSHLVPGNFDRALSSLWSCCAAAVSAVIDRGIAAKYSAARFAHLYHAFRVLINFFFGEEASSQEKDPARILRTLKLYACRDTGALVLHYYALRYARQQQQQSSFKHGSVTVRALLQASHLRVEVLNARHLKPAELLLNKDNKEQTDLLYPHSSKDLESMASSASSSSFFSTYPRRGIDNAAVIVPGSQVELFPLPLPPLQQESKSESRHRRTRCYPTTPRNWSSNNSDTAKFGFFQSKIDSVRLSVQEAHVLMHRNLASNSGHCNPYVSVRLVPAARFASIKVRTKIQPRTLFPLFDETFDLVLPEDCNMDSGFLQVTVKDKGVMGEGIFLGEAFLPLRDLVQSNLDVRLQDLPQTQLPLTRPGGDDDGSLDELLFAIQTRSSSDSATKEFLRKERRKRLF